MKNKKSRTILKWLLVVGFAMLLATIVLIYITTKQEENNRTITVDPDTMKLVQLDAPQEGDPIAIVDTTLGEFRFVLYPQYAPNQVASFTELANSGYYDGTYVFNSDSGVYSSAGSKTKSGDLTDTDAPCEKIERELHQDLWPFKGAICSLPTGSERTFKEKIFGGGIYYNGSRFAIVNTIEFDDEIKEQLLDGTTSNELGQAFIDKGGIPNFSQQMTIFGQTYEGFDVVEKLASLDTENNGYYHIPKDEVKINSIVISEYSVD